MMKSILAAGVSLLALSAVSAEAKTVGHVSGGANYVDNEVFSGKGVDQYNFEFEGAAAFDLTPSWNLQFDTHFKSDRLSGGGIFGGKSLAIDTWRAGTQVFWRDSSKGMFGAELAYNSLDTGIGGSLDGFLAGLKGAYFGSDSWTLGGGVTYNTYEANGGSLDTWSGNLYGTYYVNEKTGLSLRGNYSDTDISGSSSNFKTWSIGADAEYLFQNNLSLAGVVTYGDTDVSSSSFDQWTIGAKLKVYFGTEGSLANQHRTGALDASLPQQLPIFAF